MESYLESDIVFDRDIEEKFNTWYNEFNDKVLYVQGARQVGETFTINKFLKTKFNNVIYINLSESNEFINLIKSIQVDNNALSLLIEFINNNNLAYTNDENTVIFIDEIQESIDVYNHMRLLKRATKCCWVISGSYLGILLRNTSIYNNVGGNYVVRMSIVTFKEFCRMCNVPYAFSESTMQLYKIYLKIGGYPEVITTFLTHFEQSLLKAIDRCHNVLLMIWNVFTDDCEKYSELHNYKGNFKNCLKLAIVETIREKQGFSHDTTASINASFIENELPVISKIKDKYKRDAYAWLCSLGMLYKMPVTVATDKELANNSENRCRYFICDVGLFWIIAEGLRLEETAIKGYLAECFVYSELCNTVNGFIDKKGGLSVIEPKALIYNGQELDFVLPCGSKSICIEVKFSNDKEEINKTLIAKNVINLVIKTGLLKENSINKHQYNYPIYLIGNIQIKDILQKQGINFEIKFTSFFL